MLECKDVRPFLAEYEAGTLPEEQAAQMADHLLLCPICAAALEDLRHAQECAAVMPSPAAETEDAAETAQVAETVPKQKLPRWGKALIAFGALVLIAAIVVAVLYTPKPADDPVDPDFGLPPAGNGQIQPRTAGVADALSLCADAQEVA